MHPLMPYVVGLPSSGAAYGASMLALGSMTAAGSTNYGAQPQANPYQAVQSQRGISNQRRAAVPARQQVGFDAPDDCGLAYSKGSTAAEGQDTWQQRGQDQGPLHLQSKQHQHGHQQQPMAGAVPGHSQWHNDVAGAQMAAAIAAAGQPMMSDWELTLLEQQLRQPNSGMDPQAQWSQQQQQQAAWQEGSASSSSSTHSAAAASHQGHAHGRAALYGDFRRGQRYAGVDAATMHAAAVQSRRYQLQQQQQLQQQLHAQHAAAEARQRASAQSSSSTNSRSGTECSAPSRSSSFGPSGAARPPKPPKGAPPPPPPTSQQNLPGMRQQPSMQQLQAQQPEPIVLEGAGGSTHSLAQLRAAKAHATAQATAAALAGAAAASAAQWQARQPQGQQQQQQQQLQQQLEVSAASGSTVLYGESRRFYLRCAKDHIQEHGTDEPQGYLLAVSSAHRPELAGAPQQQQQQQWLGSGSDSSHSTATSAWAHSSFGAAAVPQPPATPADLPSALVCSEELRAEWAAEDEADAVCFIGTHGAPAMGKSGSGGGAKMQCGGDAYGLRLLRIAEVSLCVDALAPAALMKANAILSSLQIPGNITYMPVAMDSFLFQMGAQWKFSAFAIALGSSYFQRLLEAVPQLKVALRNCAAFRNYAQWVDAHSPDAATANQASQPGHHLQQQQQQQQQQGHQQQAAESALRSIQFTCIFLATKAVDQVHALGLLRFMLCALSHGRAMMTAAAAAEVESRCLKGLQWRLGPYFAEDVLNDMCEEVE